MSGTPAHTLSSRTAQWAGLRRDPVFLLTLAVFGLFVALYSLPVVSYRMLESFIAGWADLLLIGLAVLGFQWGKKRLHPEERTFWNLMTAAFVCYSGGVWLGLLIPETEWIVTDRMVEYLFFLLQFVFMFLALSLNPHTEEANWSINSIRFRLESMGTVSFAALVFVYFAIIPAYFGQPGQIASLHPRTMLVAIEPLLLFSFLYIASFSSNPRWTRIYRLFALAIGMWLVSDIVELAISANWIPGGIPYGTAYDFLWYLPFAVAVAAARLGRSEMSDRDGPAPGLPARNSKQIRYMFGPLAVYTTALPLIHFFLSATGSLDDAGRAARETCVLFGLLLLGSLTLVNEKLIERQRRKTEAENKRLAAFPIKNPNPFMTFSGDGTLKFLNPAAIQTMQELELDSVEEFLPPRHSTLVTDCMLGRSAFRDIEVTVEGRVFSFGYYPNPSGDDVFVYVMDVTERKRAEGKLKFDALHDTLTGLPNRTLVLEILSRSIERAQRNPDFRFGVLFLDLNRFKLVNDSLGHLAGDRFLVEIAKRLERSLRPNDVVGRFGGDEFVIIVDDVRGAADVTKTAERVQEEVARPLVMEGQEIITSACIGIALSDTARVRPEEYLRDADIAMYRAKSKGMGGFEVFDQEMHEQAVAQLKLENRLRRAIDEDELVLYYQPYVSLTSGRIVGFEGLIRWQNPEFGLVPPGQFIPLAEDIGLIIPIGWWVIEQACDKLETWLEMVGDDADFTVSVNVSSKQLGEAAFVEKLDAILSRHSFDRKRLCLEITESVVTDLGDEVIQLLERIKELGVKLAVDDFGTGYSSLSYLRTFPIDVLKIDRAFVSTMEKSRKDIAIVRAITTLTRTLKLTAIAEGVETLEQANKLRALSCRVAQGYLYSPPVPGERAEHMLHEDLLGGRRLGGQELEAAS